MTPEPEQEWCCPTCGSDDPQWQGRPGGTRWGHRHVMKELSCPDPFHDPPEDRGEHEHEAWACSICGFHPESRRTWCAAGCGPDYREMVRLSVDQPEAHELKAELEKARADRDRFDDEAERLGIDLYEARDERDRAEAELTRLRGEVEAMRNYAFTGSDDDPRMFFIAHRLDAALKGEDDE